MVNGRVTEVRPDSAPHDVDHLVQEASNGSDNAFIALWKIFYPKLLNYLRRFSQDAEDLCSEVWIRIAGSIKGFPGNGSAFQADGQGRHHLCHAAIRHHPHAQDICSAINSQGCIFLNTARALSPVWCLLGP